MLPFTTDDLQSVLMQLEQAINNHEQWSKALDRTLICRGQYDPRDVSEDAHRQCQFGLWYYNYAPPTLHRLPAFMAIEAEHARMHELARHLLLSTGSGEPVSADDYDDFAHALERLRLQIHTLRRELGEQLYNRDPLTGANTRIGLLTELREQHELVKRKVQPCCLAMMDMDHFKAINDSHGHQAGDRVLAGTAHYVIEHLRPYDKLFRYGGEEFLICLPGMSVDAALAVVERLREGIAHCACTLPDGATLHATASFGLAELDARLPVEASMDRADKALYAAKAAGRNCSRLWNDSL